MTSPTDPEPQVKAAGGVVWRQTDASAPSTEVLIVHRPRYDDWSLPKGKLDEGETFEAAAMREIAEETGVTGDLGPVLGDITYIDHHGRSKVVRWWAVRARELGVPEDSEEVDEMRWLSIHDACALLSYDSDVEVLGRFRDTVLP